MKQLEIHELQNILDEIDPFTVDCQGSHVHRHQFSYPIGVDIDLCTEIIVTSSCVPAKPINEGGYIKFEEQESTHMVDFELTALWVDGENILTEDQMDIVESHLLDIIVFN